MSGGPGSDWGSLDRRDRDRSVESAKSSRRYRTRRVRVGPGIILKKIKDRRGPNRIFVLTVAQSAGPRIDTALAGDVLKGFERTSTMAGRKGAVAAVNGDFGLLSGRPAHHFAEDGDVKQTSRAYGYHFSAAADGSQSFGGHREVTLDSVVARGERWMVRRWNDVEPGTGELTASAPSAGGLQRIPSHACSVRLSKPMSSGWEDGEEGIETQHTVQAVGCGAAAMALSGGIVVSARAMGEEGAFVRGLVPGDPVTLTWTLGWPGVTDTIGGYPQLIRNGQVVATSCAESLCKRHPRTGVGIRPDGTLLLVVVDGRRKRWSRGMTLVKFAREFERLGAVWAMNLDGGGSSTMWVRGRGIVNRPSDRRERYVSSALLVLGGPDGGEGGLTTAQTGAPKEGEAQPDQIQDPQAGTIAAEDAGSTGGFLDALASGALGPSMRLTGELQEILSLFEAAQRSE